eukprot:Gregarina_sp_Poly_1__8179@NODE_473_length_8111_cov_180_478369_g383_i0_p2_GENE_NODE_473_length_8111_cov_180_478369_g383_i0NODE_473_length_8111_cov_180_478369_g383_i0_p2_ORF_typecomplete_len250_score48_24Proteasome/PF00227_26/1_8e53Proteasome_A_N/PF10584_9/1_9e13_NODE_473_length_8111_cov_180_478369_g383_i06561405
MSRYDSRTTTFSPAGRLFQVEYALEAINNASSTLGMLTKEGVVLAADKMVTSKLLDQSMELEKLYKIDDQILCAVAGWTADANVLLHQARLSSQRHLFRYDEPMSPEALVVHICDTKQSYTQFGGLRPFGVSFLIAGWDKNKGFQLYHTDPAGNFGGWRTTAIGQNSLSAQQILKQEWHEDLTLDQGLLLAARVLTKTTDSTSSLADMVEFAVLKLEDGKPKQYFLSAAEIAKLLEEAAKEPVEITVTE